MPIKPENSGRYPPNWKEVVEQVRARSENRCESSPAFPDCRAPNGWLRNNRTEEFTNDGTLAEAWELADGDRVTLIVLTVGHLDHKPENCDLRNLRHWCQRCHLNYDAKHHAQSAYITRRAGRAIADLFA